MPLAQSLPEPRPGGHRPGAAELLYAVGVHGRAGAPVPQIAAARRERVRSLDPDIAGVERKGVAAFDAVTLEGLAPPFPPPQAEGGLGRGQHRRPKD